MQDKKTIFAGVLFIGIAVFSLLGWLAVDRAIAAQGEVDWLSPALWFSLAVPLLCLFFVSIRKKWLLALAFSCFFLPGIALSLSFLHALWTVLAALIVLGGLQRMKRDVDSRVSIHLGKSLHLGMILVVLGVSLVISSYYYVQVKPLPLEGLLPRFRISESSGKIFMRSLSRFNPQLRQIAQENLTVDELILAFRKDAGVELADEDILRASGMHPQDPVALAQLSEWRRTIGEKSDELEQEMLLQEGRRQFSDAVGRELTGQEKAFDVFSELVNDKLRSYFAPSDNLPFPLLPLVLSVLLFLTLLSLGSVLQWLWIGLSAFFFFLAVRSGGVTVKKVMVEKEVIE
jgi:hypothetical protein